MDGSLKVTSSVSNKIIYISFLRLLCYSNSDCISLQSRIGYACSDGDAILYTDGLCL